jgi:putative heme-binding domain-containing protein
MDGRGGEHAPNIVTAVKVRALFDRDLASIIRLGIPGTGMPEFGSSLSKSEIEAVVKYVRLLQGRTEAATLVGNAEHGRALFFGIAGCSSCHMIDGKGGFIGADLSGYGKTHSATETRDAIVTPNKNLDMRRGTAVAVTRDGKEFTGVVRNEDNFSVQMQTPDGVFHLFSKADLVRLEHKTESLMPAWNGLHLTKNDLDDLIAYLLKAAPGNQ